MKRRARPGPTPGSTPRPRSKPRRRRVLVVTGSRAEFGLLRPVMDAIRRHPRLELLVACAGAHWLAPARTHREVEQAFGIDARVPMQRPDQTGRLADARATARGVEGVARALARLEPEWVVVLGDRIEAFAAAAAASIAGLAVAHIHGGDRAEGIADEALRHAITKLAHLHCAATAQSAQRLVQLGERPEHVHTTGSPAIDGLDALAPLDDASAAALGNPRTIILLHPSGLPAPRERALVHAAMYGVEVMSPGNVLCLAPNHDAGRELIAQPLLARCRATSFLVDYPFRGPLPTFRLRARPARKPFKGIERHWHWREHLPRSQFLALLKRLAHTPDHPGGLLVGNSSAGLIEAQALGLRVVNLGPRQDGRERGNTLVDVPEADLPRIVSKFDLALSLDRPRAHPSHPFGDGHAGPRIADLLAATDPHDPALLRKRNTY